MLQRFDLSPMTFVGPLRSVTNIWHATSVGANICTGSTRSYRQNGLVKPRLRRYDTDRESVTHALLFEGRTRMLSTALFALLIVSAQPEVPGPLSPASLPPPSTPATADPKINFGCDSGLVDVHMEHCRERALAAVAAQPGFRYAQINTTGQGYTDTCRFVVLMDLVGEATYAFMAAVSLSLDADKLTRDVWNHR